MTVAGVTGRFQPIHGDHVELIRAALTEHDHVIVGVTNASSVARSESPLAPHRHRADANPFDFVERCQLIAAALDDHGVGVERWSVVAFPLDEPHDWTAAMAAETVQYLRIHGPWEQRKADLLATVYPVRALGGPRRVSGTDIRRRLGSAVAVERANGWQELVSPQVATVIARLLNERSWDDRTSAAICS